MEKYIYFIADLHLSPHNNDLFVKFKYFLQSIEQKCDALYILGDLFDYWIGHEDNWVKSVYKLLQNFSTKMSIYFLVGNRDFLIGQDFTTMTGCYLLTEPYLINYKDRKFLLLHGDILCQNDKYYQVYRKFVRTNLVKKIFSFLPWYWRYIIANKIRSVSKYHAKRKTQKIMDVTYNKVMQTYMKYKVDVIIHGHTHRPQLHSYCNIDKTQNFSCYQRLVLGDWHSKGAFIGMLSNDGNIHLNYFS